MNVSSFHGRVTLQRDYGFTHEGLAQQKLREVVDGFDSIRNHLQLLYNLPGVDHRSAEAGAVEVKNWALSSGSLTNANLTGLGVYRQGRQSVELRNEEGDVTLAMTKEQNRETYRVTDRASSFVASVENGAAQIDWNITR